MISMVDHKHKYQQNNTKKRNKKKIHRIYPTSKKKGCCVWLNSIRKLKSQNHYASHRVRSIQHRQTKKNE